MKREIKFRAWDEENKKIIYPEHAHTLKITFFGSIIYYDTYINDWELMQFTGIKDKNGKEIYEYDIVMAHYMIFEEIGITEHKGMVVFNTNEVAFTVNTFDYIYRVKGFRSEGYQTMDLFPLNNSVVIGNIFENPELLEKIY